ncbi:MAG: hypothetical protein WD095_01070 [Candidatus Paceibacterota bacterium]
MKNLPIFLIDLDYFISRLRRTSVEFLVISDEDNPDLGKISNKFENFINKIEILTSKKFKERKKSDNNILILNRDLDFEVIDKINNSISSDDKRAVSFPTKKNNFSKVGDMITDFVLKIFKINKEKKNTIKPGGNVFYLSKEALMEFEVGSPELSFLDSFLNGSEWNVVDNPNFFPSFNDYLILWFNLIKLKLKSIYPVRN